MASSSLPMSTTTQVSTVVEIPAAVHLRHDNVVAANRDADDQNRDLEAQTPTADPTDPTTSTDANVPATPATEKATADARAPADPKAPAVPIKRRPRFRCTCTTIIISIMFIVILLIVCMVIGYALRHRLWPKDHRDLQGRPW